MNNQNTPKGLEHLNTYEPKPELWTNIEAQLDKDNNKKIIYWRWARGIAASVALIMVIQFFIGQNDDLAQLNKESLAEAAMNSSYPTNQKVEPKEPPAPIATGLDTTSETNTATSVEPTNIDQVNPSNGSEIVVTLADSMTTSYFVSTSNTIITNETGSADLTTYNFNTTPNLSYSAVPGGKKFYIPTEQEKYQVTLPANAQGVIANSSAIQQGTLSYDWSAKPDANAGYVNSYNLTPMESSNANGYDTDYDGIAVEMDIDEDAVGDVNDWSFGDGDIKTGEMLRKSQGNSGSYWVNTEPYNTESYYPLVENEYENPLEEPLSTFGIDVDNASYSVMRTKLRSNQIVPKDAVRVEEFVNYFDYNYPQPTTNRPFSVNLENAVCPWNSNHQLVRIGLKGKDIDYNDIQHSNLVFLIDVSGSMAMENKLSLVKKSLKLLVDQMGRNDRIAIVTYAGAAGLVLPSTRCDEKALIKKRIDKLDAGGSTAGGQGIKLAYKVAYENLIRGGNNRVIMCTDGDFNVGASSDEAMKNLIIENRNKGIFITACGFGMGNYQDSKMETIADNGNGNYFYIDTYRESEKVFKRDLRATLFTIAKDVKIQVEFNPKHVKAYRLIGYENRKMPPQDFNDDTKDGGELGAGHTVTALYEVIPASSSEAIPGRLELKYQQPSTSGTEKFGNELLTVKLRYKKPNGNVSTLYETTLAAGTKSFSNASEDFRFATGVALFGQQLRQSKFIELNNFNLAKQITTQAKGNDPNGDRQELIDLINQASNTYRIYTEH